MLNYTCYICDFRTEDRKAYISHVKEVHGEFIKRHVLAHKYGGVVPVCKECGAEVAFNEKQIDFNSYCVNHKKLAQIEWSKNNGFGAKMDPKQNLGKTMEEPELLWMLGPSGSEKPELPGPMRSEGLISMKKNSDLFEEQRVVSMNWLG